MATFPTARSVNPSFATNCLFSPPSPDFISIIVQALGELQSTLMIIETKVVVV